MSILISKLQKQSGTSFLEVIIALVLMGIITTSIFKVYIAQHKNYLTQEDVTEIQQSTRASIDVIAKSVRMAGYQVPENLASILSADTDPDTITVLYLVSECKTLLSEPMPQPSAELKGTGDISCFYDGQWVYIYDADSNSGEWFEITHVQADDLHLQHNTMQLSRSYDAGADILALNLVKFFIDNTTNPDLCRKYLRSAI